MSTGRPSERGEDAAWALRTTIDCRPGEMPTTIALQLGERLERAAAHARAARVGVAVRASGKRLGWPARRGALTHDDDRASRTQAALASLPAWRPRRVH